MFKFIDNDADTPLTKLPSHTPGKVSFDDRGNAIYEWAYEALSTDDQQAQALRERALLNPTLALIDDTPEGHGVRNDKGLRLGYNPYESGQLAGKQVARKRDMRELSKWIEMKRRLDAQKK